ncbi:MAG: GNAT family N-acetyltransferase [Clostridiales bacterium]|nr:GNAT family N-acetyltransferase [Clostridiales bacterium]
MDIRLFDASTDFDVIRGWISDERTHMLWCAGRLPFGYDLDEFVSFLEGIHSKNGDVPYVAVSGGKPVGFYTYSASDSEGMLKFVVVDPSMRGQGIGSEMLRLAAAHAFEDPSISAVHLNVFSSNLPARKCYEKVGFVERNITPSAFSFGSESWDRVNMILYRSAL